jgi:hypothetical protein
MVGADHRLVPLRPICFGADSWCSVTCSRDRAVELPVGVITAIMAGRFLSGCW